MGMAALFALFLGICPIIIPALAQNLMSCDTTSPEASGHRCNANGLQNRCKTFAVFFGNSHYSSLSNLTSCLGLSRSAIAEANGLPAEAGAELFGKDQPLLIPIECGCDSDGFFGAELVKGSTKGESFLDIASSLEGLTTCKAIQAKNPGVSSLGLGDGVRLRIPLRCACPSPSELGQGTRLLLSYPILRAEDTILHLAAKFNTTPEAVASANDRSVADFEPGKSPSVLIPLPDETILRAQNSTSSAHKKKRSQKKKKKEIVAILAGVFAAAAAASIAIAAAAAAAFFVLRRKKGQQSPGKTAGEMESQQQLGLSARAPSDKKVSFDGQAVDATPRKNHSLETYTLLELRKATEDFSPANRIGGDVFRGRLNGESLAIKRVTAAVVPEIEFDLFRDKRIHSHHPNIVRLLGTCLTEGPADMCLVFEYAKNGSLEDWLRGGLAMKSHFISSCHCFLTWGQRLRICLDVAAALRFMHHVMSPSYVHGSIRSRNIFLDEELKAKVGSFGMGKCAEGGKTDEEAAAPSADIFAYGMVLVEVLCGQAPIVDSGLLPEKIRSILRSDDVGELRELMDGALGEDYSFDAAVALATLAKDCLEEEPSSRPSAGEIVEKLSGWVEELPAGEQSLVCESSCKPLVKGSCRS